MVDQDILLAKIASIQKCLERIRRVTGGNCDSLDDPDVQDIFVLNLQRAVQAAIDLAAHQVADEKIGLPGLTAFLSAKPQDSCNLESPAGFQSLAHAPPHS